MQAARPPLLRGAILLIALAAIAFIMARGDSPAAATSYNPQTSVSVSDPTPGAAADIVINFSLDAPDAFPNVKTNSSIQFLPRQWGIHTPETDGASAPQVGGIAGSFNAITNIGLMGISPCFFTAPVPFTMYDANPGTSSLTSALDIGGVHPGGVGYSGQFVDDPNTIQPPGDVTDPPTLLRGMNPDEKHTGSSLSGSTPTPYLSDQHAYRDMDNNGYVSPGDIRLTEVFRYPPGSVVQRYDFDTDWINTGTFGAWLRPFPASVKHSDIDGNTQMDPGENIYKDVDGSGTVTYGDLRLFEFGGTLPFGSTVELFRLPGGVSRYPDFLNQMFPPDVVGDPLARQFGAKDVLGTAVSLNIVTYRPGQLPGYPATLGYPNVVVILDPVAPIEAVQMNLTSDLCAPLTLTSTNLGVSQDNPATLPNEGGYVRLTNPKAEKDHTFTLITTSQPDADNDGIENMLDTCPFTPNTEDLDGKSFTEGAYGADFDSLDGSCDPDPENPSLYSPFVGTPDEDQDNYANRADNCPLVANGVNLIDMTYAQTNKFLFWYGISAGYIGPNDQKDTDGDDIGDACDPDSTPVTGITGHMHVETRVNAVPIFKHGIKLNNLGGPKNVNSGARTYSVDVSNLGSSAEDVQVGLRVVEGCAAVSGPSSVSVAADGSATASFTVDFTGCAAGTYTVQADACHAGDAAPAGLFGSGACPGTSDGMTDPNPLDDAPIAKSVEVGTP